MFPPATQERLVLVGAVLLRVLVGLSSYSGMNDPPKYGDYEAQRHWMELTINLPVQEWYTDSAVNPREYWPLDYPPLSGYQSWVHGQFLRRFEPASVVLGDKSRGYETPTSKRLMRATVLLSDLLVYFPAALLATRALYGPHASPKRAFALATTLLNPALVIVDHGHFQYNCISLGLALLGAALIARGRHVLGSVCFCGALNHKQMALFFAPAFFAHLLGKCLANRGLVGKVGGVVKLGLAVVASFVVLWSPWLTIEEAARRVVARIFPLRRGLFEDYVANWWCTSSVLVKWKQLVPGPEMVTISAACTLAAALPSMVQQLWRPSSKGLLLGMANSGFAFFMLAYQVHEKSVLLPLTPIMVLAGDQPTAVVWLPLVSMVSMWPLLHRDGLALPYAALCLSWAGLMLAWAPSILALSHSTQHGTLDPAANGSQHHDGSNNNSSMRHGGGGRGGGGGARWRRRLGAVVRWALGGGFVAAALAVHAAAAWVPPPERLPWLWDRAFVTLAFAGLALGALHLQVAQWRLPPQATYRWDEQDRTVRKKDL